MAVKNPEHRKLTKTQVYMENMSFDQDYEVLTRIPLTLNPVSGTLERSTAIQGNPALDLTYDLAGNLETITKTVGATSYVKTLTWTDGKLSSVSEWVAS